MTFVSILNDNGCVEFVNVEDVTGVAILPAVGRRLVITVNGRDRILTRDVDKQFQNVIEAFHKAHARLRKGRAGR